MTSRELTLNEMENVVGGRGGSPTCLPDQAGFEVYRIRSGDTLGKIAARKGTTAEYLKSINPSIHNVHDITPGYYIYVPE